jgi:hypothetical protein
MHTKQWILTNSRVRSLPLSVEGHVNTLIKVCLFSFSSFMVFFNLNLTLILLQFQIKEATDDRNLSQMYIGWSAFY